VGVEADDDLVDAIQPPLTLADDPWLMGVPLRSRGTSNSTVPASVANVLGV
jgi:hypothetical protein